MSDEFPENISFVPQESIIYVDAMNVFKGEVIISQEDDCKCEVDHPKSAMIPVIVVAFRDHEGKEYHMTFPVESELTKAFTSQDISYRVRALVED